MSSSSMHNKKKFRYQATGSAAHLRIRPLLFEDDWIDATDNDDSNIDFLWENAPRRRTQPYRDTVQVYSHLPNGRNILDCKWVLGRLFSEARAGDDSTLLATLETHCFRGVDGFDEFAKRVNLFRKNATKNESKNTVQLVDLLLTTQAIEACEPNNWWVVKDAQANGAGGIWVVSPENASEFISKEATPLFQEHKYVAQKYVWPPVLFGGRKCHVRVYGLLTCDGRAFVHQRAFLHVANDQFSTSNGIQLEDSVHITNCCANSHDNNKFAGEILADLTAAEESKRDGETVVPLGKFFPSIQACVQGLAKRVVPFLQGGQANHGFEYLGMDFILSETNDDSPPLAYLLEINAPPSQDTATGLPHAENLHDDVIRDLIHLWVLPKITGAVEQTGGWHCVYKEETSPSDENSQNLIVPSKASILNKIRWAIFERKMQKKEREEAILKSRAPPHEQQHQQDEKGTKLQQSVSTTTITKFVRSQFPYFYSPNKNNDQPPIFLENAGGSQVSQPVMDAILTSLSHRNRSVIGANTKRAARDTFQNLLGATPADSIFLGPNASSLLLTLANVLLQLDLLTADDEIVVSIDNHLANVSPWEQAAKCVDAKLIWWSPLSTTPLEDVISSRTKLVALPHASNICGQVHNIGSMAQMIKFRSAGGATIVVDGVAASPHWFPNVEKLNVDWYVVSGHKLFGPHVAGLYGRGSTVQNILPSSPGASATGSSGNNSEERLYSLFECGTVNYEGCAGIVGLGAYFSRLASHSDDAGQECGESSPISITQSCLSQTRVQQAYARIRQVEAPLVRALLTGLQHSSPRVRILQRGSDNAIRLPIISFVHDEIDASTIYDILIKNGMACRVSSFLSTTHLRQALDFDQCLRVSLAHYNTMDEVGLFLQTLTSINGWKG